MALKRVSPGLKDKTLTTGKKKLYSDVDLTFARKPGTLVDGVYVGDIYKKIDTAAVVQSVENILLTNYYEKPFEPFYGANIRAMLFETIESYSDQLVTRMITEAIDRWEPRATVIDVEYYAGDELIPKGVIALREYAKNSIYIKVEFKIENIEESFIASVNMNRLR